MHFPELRRHPLAYYVGEAFTRYFRVQTRGTEHVRREGPLVVVANHSGVTALDALVLGYVLARESGRPARILAHAGYFDWLPALGKLATGFGLYKASFRTGIRLLRDREVVVIFPEGESGNFKPSTEAYRLRPFQDGFARMALDTGATIIPCVIVGAEETHLNLGAVRLKRAWVPLPLNLLPLPARWKIRFLSPLKARAETPKRLEGHALAVRARERMQTVLDREISRRKYVYFPFLRTLARGHAGARRPVPAARNARAGTRSPGARRSGRHLRAV